MAATYPAVSAFVQSPNCAPRRAGARITHVILHLTGNLADHTAYFSRRNERSVAPHLYPRPDGLLKQFVRFGWRAWTTAVPLDENAITFEIEAVGDATPAQYETVARFIAWLADQTELDGIPVDFEISRARVIGHREAPGVTSGTVCPVNLDIARIVARAQALAQQGDRMNGLQLVEAAVQRWRDGEGAGTSADQQCQKYSGWYEQRVLYRAEELVPYASAIIAARASARQDVGGDINRAPVGAFVFWDVGQYGHVARIIGTDAATGRKLASMTGLRGTVVRQFSNDIRVVYADSYRQGPYLGWAWRNGVNPPVEITPWNLNEPVVPDKPKEIVVKTYHREDHAARNGGRVLRPGETFHLQTLDAAAGQASNIVGGDGHYSIAVHVYAEGTPGDAVDLRLTWRDTRTEGAPMSPHYRERIEVGLDGTAYRTVMFQRGVDRGYAVAARIDAPRTNRGDAVRVTLLDTDATLYRVA